jgi:hypothetical protein
MIARAASVTGRLCPMPALVRQDKAFACDAVSKRPHRFTTNLEFGAPVSLRSKRYSAAS